MLREKPGYRNSASQTRGRPGYRSPRLIRGSSQRTHLRDPSIAKDPQITKINPLDDLETPHLRTHMHPLSCGPHLCPHTFDPWLYSGTHLQDWLRIVHSSYRWGCAVFTEERLPLKLVLFQSYLRNRKTRGHFM